MVSCAETRSDIPAWNQCSCFERNNDCSELFLEHGVGLFNDDELYQAGPGLIPEMFNQFDTTLEMGFMLSVKTVVEHTVTAVM
jgi:hypothetical protein